MALFSRAGRPPLLHVAERFGVGLCCVVLCCVLSDAVHQMTAGANLLSSDVIPSRQVFLGRTVPPTDRSSEDRLQGLSVAGQQPSGC